MEFRLPDLGEGLHEGEIVEWRVKEGELIAEDAPLVEVMTDKATVEITSPVAGTVSQLCAAEGDIVPVGKVIAVIDEAEGGSAPAARAEPAAAPAARAEPAAAPVMASAAAAVPPPPAAATATATATLPRPVASHAGPASSGSKKVLASPAVRRRAREAGIALASVPASGPNGRVTRDDFARFVAGAAAPASAAAPAPSAAPVAAPAAVPAPQPLPAVSGDVEIIPIRGLRRKIKEQMTLSTSRAAHFCYVDEVDVTELVALRKRLKPKAEKRGVKLTYLPFIFKALAAALPDFPRFNSHIDDAKNELRVYPWYNFGMAVDGPDGLVVPVVQNVQGRSLFNLCGEIARLAGAVRSKKASIADLKGGTFTITSAGSIGGLFATPIINYPEVAIVGVHKIKKRAVVLDDDSIAVRQIMYLSMSLDHRIIDGADAARFMNRVVELLEDPELLFFESL